MKASCLATFSLLAFCFFSATSYGDVQIEPEAEENFFKLNLTYTFDRATPDPRYFRAAFALRDLFFLDSDDIALEIDFYGPFQNRVRFAKWGFFDYRLAFGFEFDYVLNTSVDAQFADQNSFYISDFLGNRFAFVPFVRYSIAPDIAFSISYGLEANLYRIGNRTPPEFVLPADNLGFPLTYAFSARGGDRTGLSWYALLLGTHLRRGPTRSYGLGRDRMQFREGHAVVARGFVHYWDDPLFLLAGITPMGGSDGLLRIGTPLAQEEMAEEILYGFPQNQLSVSYGALHRIGLQLDFFSGLISPKIQMAFLIARENNRRGIHVQQGWSAGLESSIPIPLIGSYCVGAVYQQGHTDVESGYNLFNPWNFQVLFSIKRQLTW